MKTQARKCLVVVAMLVPLIFVATGLEAKKPVKPDTPDDDVTGALNCELVTDGSDTVLNDGLGTYMDGEDKVACAHGGTTQPNLSGIQLNTISKGPIKRAVRKIDLAFGECVGPACEYVPLGFLETAQDIDDMEDIWIGTGPYPDDPEMTHIQLMAPGKWEMKSHMSPQGLADRFVVQLMNREEFPAELGQGGWCNLDNHPVFTWADAKTTEDITVCIWPDNDGNSFPDGYTITTGDTDCLTTWPSVMPRERIATICSTTGPESCDGDMCNLLGTVPLQFTLHATYQ